VTSAVFNVLKPPPPGSIAEKLSPTFAARRGQRR